MFTRVCLFVLLVVCTAAARDISAQAANLEVHFAPGSARLSAPDAHRLRETVASVGVAAIATARISVAQPSAADANALAREMLSGRLGRAGAHEADLMSMEDIENLFAHYRHVYGGDPRDLLPAPEPDVSRTRQEELMLMIALTRERLLAAMPVNAQALERLTRMRLRALEQALVGAGVPVQAVEHGAPLAERAPGDTGVPGWLVLERRHP